MWGAELQHLSSLKLWDFWENTVDPLHTKRCIYQPSVRNSETEKITISHRSDNLKIMMCEIYYHKWIIIYKIHKLLIFSNINFANYNPFVVKHSTCHCCPHATLTNYSTNQLWYVRRVINFRIVHWLIGYFGILSPTFPRFAGSGAGEILKKLRFDAIS